MCKEHEKLTQFKVDNSYSLGSYRSITIVCKAILRLRDLPNKYPWGRMTDCGLQDEIDMKFFLVLFVLSSVERSLGHNLSPKGLLDYSFSVD